MTTTAETPVLDLQERAIRGGVGHWCSSCDVGWSGNDARCWSCDQVVRA